MTMGEGWELPTRPEQGRSVVEGMAGNNDGLGMVTDQRRQFERTGVTWLDA